MSGILDLINNGVGKQIIENISNKVGTSEGETTNVLNSALPLLVNAMQNNLSTETDATGLLGTLLNDKQNSNSLENPKSLVNDGIETQDGSKILKHILGNNQSLLEKNISLSTGIATDKINSILQMAAPLLMSFLAGKAKSANIQNGTDLVDLSLITR
ncbi:DUF937 domain-containing protein [Flavobacterium davisii]|uniref:DUF937 domain-containing protein n=1 Tax=Flavobacterium davisii TaxID=2906077 RepID=UPI000B4C53AF|nr:DUF937 domain-containing protein [Flavobacterium davisii]